MSDNTETAKSPGFIDRITSNPSHAAGTLIVAGGAYLGYKLFIKPAIDKKREKEVEDAASGDVNVQQALQLRDAMNPSGIAWMRSMDGTREEEILGIGKNVTNLQSVQDAYYKRTERNLLDDLRSELSGDRFQSFMTAVNLNTPTQTVVDGKGNKMEVASGAGAKSKIRVGRYLYAKKKVNLRSTPEITSTGGGVAAAAALSLIISGAAAAISSFKGSNILQQFSPGEFIGYAPGPTAFDSKSNTKFIKVTYFIDPQNKYCPKKYKKLKAPLEVTGWVSASTDLVDQYDYWKTALDAGYRIYPWKVYKAPGVNGLGSMPRLPRLHIPQVQVISDEAVILDKDMRWKLGKAEEGAMLGQRLLTVSNHIGRFTQFKDKLGNIRWVKTKDVAIV